MTPSHVVLEGDILDKLPWLIIEEMNIGYRGAITTEILPITRTPHIESVHAIRFSSSGCYIGKDFGRNPHYTVSDADFEVVVKKICSDNGLHIKYYSRTRAVSSSSILTVFNMDNGDLGKIGELVRKLTSTPMTPSPNNSTGNAASGVNNEERSWFVDCPLHDNAQRGARQRHFGYSSNYSLKRLPAEEGGRVCPRLLGGKVDPEIATIFEGLSELGDEMFNHEASKALRGESRKDLYGNTDRNSRFANRIHPNSKVEALTISETSNTGGQLKVHVDVNNDESTEGKEDNYNYVLCCWGHRAEVEIVREAKLGYSRRSVGDFDRREAVCHDIVDKVIRPWVQKCPDWRKECSIDTRIFGTEYFEGAAREDGMSVYFPPTFNKQATYLSAYSDSLLHYQCAYERAHGMKMTVEKKLEIVLPVMFGTSASTYRKVLQEWTVDKRILRMARTENMTSYYIDYCNTHHQSVRAGDHPRHQPTFNKDPKPSWIIATLRSLREAVIQSVKCSAFSFKCMTERVMHTNGIGELLAQHLIHMMSLCGIISPRYGLEACVCLNTKTATRLYQEHKIPKSYFPCLLEYVCAEFGISKSIAENIICKSLMKDGNHFLDSIYHSQTCLMWAGIGEDGASVIFVLKRPDSRVVNGYQVRKAKVMSFDSPDLFERTGKMEEAKYNCEEALKSWWLILGSEMEKSLELELSYKKKYRSPTKKNPPLDPSPPPADPNNIKWLNIDEEDLNRYAAEYERSIKHLAKRNATAGKSDYAGNSGVRENNCDLRVVHRALRHHTTPNRTASGVSMDRVGDVKNCAQLLSMGVPQTPVNLLLVAQTSLSKLFLSRNPHFRPSGKLFLKIETETYYVVSGKGRYEVFSGRGFLKDSSSEAGLLCITMVKCQTHVLLQEDAVKNRIVTDSTGRETKYMTYTSKKSAKKSMMWYIATVICDPQTWLQSCIPISSWGSIREASSTNAQNANDTRFAVLTLQNGPVGCCKGDSFCTLVLKGSSVYARIESSRRTNERYFCLSETVVIGTIKLSPSCQVQHKDGIERAEQLRKMQIVDTDANAIGDDDIVLDHQGQERDKAVAVLVVQVEEKAVLLVGKKGKLPHTGIDRMPLEIDPFSPSHLKNREYMCEKLSLWQPFWSEQLDRWRSSYSLRSTGEHGDRYWSPPNTPISCSRKIRSRCDLTAFLDYCVGIKPIVGQSVNTKIDFESLLVSWVRETTAKKAVLKATSRTKKKRKHT